MNFSMSAILYLIPFLAIVSATFLYPYNGKREILRFDLVQFIYSFILMPAVFIWVKSFLFFLLKNDVGGSVSLQELFILDTVFSTIFIYVASFVVIHSLTKSFEIRKQRDPLYDLFEHSEYFHLWLSHTVIYGGVQLFAFFLGLINIFIELPLQGKGLDFYSLLLMGIGTGFLGYLSIVIYQGTRSRFMQLMKLIIGILTLILIISYFVFDPVFSITHIAFWFVFSAFMVMTMCVAFTEYSESASNFFERFSRFLKMPDRRKKLKRKLLFFR